MNETTIEVIDSLIHPLHVPLSSHMYHLEALECCHALSNEKNPILGFVNHVRR